LFQPAVPRDVRLRAEVSSIKEREEVGQFSSRPTTVLTSSFSPLNIMKTTFTTIVLALGAAAVPHVKRADAIDGNYFLVFIF
jgi:hypothetical protein